MMYSKSALTIAEQLEQLQLRGLIIGDVKEATRTLQNISYYRLAGYWWAMQADKNTHTFKLNSTFENVLAIYNFDRELRLLLFDVIEKIEVGVRTRIIYHLSHEFSPWWLENTSLFKNTAEHTETLKLIDRELKQTREVFIKEHYKKYQTDLRRPPAWKTLEIISFGALSKLYGNLKPTIKSKNIIAAELGTVNHTYLPSWLQSIAQIRNICAHHGRLWNKNLPGRPKLLSRPPYPWIIDVPPSSEHFMLYVHLCCMKYLLNIIHPTNDFSNRVSFLLDRYDNIDSKALGFKPNWRTEPLWVS